MSEPTWDAVDRWLEAHVAPPDEALDAALAASAAAGLPDIQVSATQGKLLAVLVRAISARRVLEVGTLGGYSTIWMARALAHGGRLVTLEAEARHADVARANLERAGLADRVEIRVGKALDSLPRLAAEDSAPFDLVFLDADKENLPEYFRWAVRLARPGALVIADNVIRKGAVVDPAANDGSVRGVRALIEQLGATPGIVATAVQTVGRKGYDGFAIAVVTGPGAAPASTPPAGHR